MTAEGNAPLYLVATDDGSDPDYATTRRAGFELAEKDGATVLLFDRSSESLMTDPYPVGPWSPEEDAVSEGTELDPQMLRNLGRQYMVDQIAEGEAQGLEVRAHLARGAGVEAFIDAVERYNPDLIIVPESLDSSALVEMLRGDTLEKVEEVGVPVRLVASDGSIREA